MKEKNTTLDEETREDRSESRIAGTDARLETGPTGTGPCTREECLYV